MDRRAPDTANAPRGPETGPVLGLRQTLADGMGWGPFPRFFAAARTPPAAAGDVK